MKTVIPTNGSPNGAHTNLRTAGMTEEPERSDRIRTVSVCDTQPVTTEGVRSLLSNCADLKLLNATDSLSHAMELARADPPDVLILDKAFGIQAILDWMDAANG